jgi:hypothetical protein
VASFTVNECPVSLITPESKRLVQILIRAERAHEASGASLYGPSLSRWPVRMLDAQVAIQQEINRESNARSEAEMEAMRRV